MATIKPGTVRGGATFLGSALVKIAGQIDAKYAGLERLLAPYPYTMDPAVAESISGYTANTVYLSRVKNLVAKTLVGGYRIFGTSSGSWKVGASLYELTRNANGATVLIAVPGSSVVLPGSGLVLGVGPLFNLPKPITLSPQKAYVLGVCSTANATPYGRDVALGVGTEVKTTVDLNVTGTALPEALRSSDVQESEVAVMAMLLPENPDILIY